MFWLHHPYELVNALHDGPEVLTLLRSLHAPVILSHLLRICTSEASTLSVSGNAGCVFLQVVRKEKTCVGSFEKCEVQQLPVRTERMCFNRPPARHQVSNAMGQVFQVSGMTIISLEHLIITE